VFFVYHIGSAANEECWKSVILTLSSKELVHESIFV
jgi:hypothetical protein